MLLFFETLCYYFVMSLLIFFTTTIFLYSGLQELARYPNVYCKASGMFAMNTKWSQDSVDMLVKPLMEYFGIDRYIFFYSWKLLINLYLYLNF